MPPEQIASKFRETLTRSDVEQFLALYFDGLGEFIEGVVVATGDRYGCPAKGVVPFTDIWGPFKLLDASSIICGHSHVIPNLAPSQADRLAAFALQRSALKEGIDLVDNHYVFFPTSEEVINFCVMTGARVAA